VYRFFRSILFLLPAEQAHHLTIRLLRVCAIIPGIPKFMEWCNKVSSKKIQRTFWGIHFPNPVGLAAGLDKNGEVFPEMALLGFGFVEIGTVTPRPQEGNPTPRLFRVVQDEAIINRMGFNNVGVEEMVENIRGGRKRYGGQVVLGGNIGKNKDTDNDLAREDYLACFEALYPYVDYFVVNVSSPNTPNLRALQDKEPLSRILLDIKCAAASKPRPKPVLLKIAPDLSPTQLDDIIDIANTTAIDGLVATNTTIGREGLSISAEEIGKIGAGGLSGKPLSKRSTEVIRYLSARTDKPIIAVGGIMSAEDAMEKFRAGAKLVQLYTGFVYEGPALVSAINKELIKYHSAPAE
jgi:dihydroorotate dehydrogenase